MKASTDDIEIRHKGGTTCRLAIVDYIKAVCIIFVVLNHSGLFNKTMPLFTLTMDKAVPAFMILSGYTYALSAKDKPLRKLYEFSVLKKKFIRFTIPMIIAFSLFLIFRCLGGNPLSLPSVFKAAALGRYGKGSYYFNLMIEFVLLAPIVYWMIRRFEANGIVLVGLMNLIYEVLCSTYGLHKALYRVIIFRYLFAIALGMYVGRFRDRKISPVHLGTMASLGVVYILLPHVWKYSYHIFIYSPWKRTSMLAVLYVFPIVYILLDSFEDYQSRGVCGRVMEKIGRASYYIMYTQMIYYVVRPAFDRIILDISKLGYAELLIDVFVAVLSGIVFEKCVSSAIRFVSSRAVRRME